MLNLLTNSVMGTTLDLRTVALCTLCSVLLGVGVAGIYMVKNHYNKGFVVTLALLPVMVQIVIMLVNGNIGTGVAVAGAFSLVRFRSLPGSARDIGSIFFAMAIGLATGMGYLFYSFLFLTVVGLFNVLLVSTTFGLQEQHGQTLKITIPEHMDYETIFDEVFSRYAQSAELEKVKTTNMGSLFELTYHIELKERSSSKSFLDDLRCLNGNLNIILARPQTEKEGL